MNYQRTAETGLSKSLVLLLTLAPVSLLAQVPVDESGEVIATYEPQAVEQATGNEDIPLLGAVDLEELVGPIALYPDDLLAVVLPATAYPLQIVDAARFLEALEDDPTLKPDPEWDDSVVALINYPEVVELLNDDIDWTWRLGEAVVSQQADVVAAIETFRDRAYAAGNLKSDSYQNVTRDEGVIEITPVTEDVIYVPYYEPERVVVYQPRPVYYYYPRAYPVYYYPYTSAYAFDHGFFWGVTTAFRIGWYSDSLNVFHHSYHGHPYYGHRYRDRWWYRRPSINVYNTTYVRRSTNVSVNRYYGGDRWRPRHNRREYVRDVRETRSRHYPTPRSENRRVQPTANVQRTSSIQRADNVRGRTDVRRNTRRVDRNEHRKENVEPRDRITFRERPQTLSMNRRAPDADTPRERNLRQQANRRSQPTPKVRQAAPRAGRVSPSTTVRRAEPAIQRTESRRSERPRASESRRQSEPRYVENTRPSSVRRQESRPDRRSTRSQDQKSERSSSRGQDRKSDRSSARRQEQNTERRAPRASERKSRHRR